MSRDPEPSQRSHQWSDGTLWPGGGNAEGSRQAVIIWAPKGESPHGVRTILDEGVVVIIRFLIRLILFDIRLPEDVNRA